MYRVRPWLPSHRSPPGRSREGGPTVHESAVTSVQQDAESRPASDVGCGDCRGCRETEVADVACRKRRPFFRPQPFSSRELHALPIRASATDVGECRRLGSPAGRPRRTLFLHARHHPVGCLAGTLLLPVTGVVLGVEVPDRPGAGPVELHDGFARERVRKAHPGGRSPLAPVKELLQGHGAVAPLVAGGVDEGDDSLLGDAL